MEIGSLKLDVVTLYAYVYHLPTHTFTSNKVTTYEGILIIKAA